MFNSEHFKSCVIEHHRSLELVYFHKMSQADINIYLCHFGRILLSSEAAVNFLGFLLEPCFIAMHSVV